MTRCKPYEKRNKDIEMNGIKLYHQKYDYIEDVGDIWDLTTDSTIEINIFQQRNEIKSKRNGISCVRWNEKKSYHIMEWKCIETNISMELLNCLSNARLKEEIKKKDFYRDIHNKFHISHENIKSDLIPLKFYPERKHTFDGSIAKHKRIGELLGVSKPIGPWNQQPHQYHAHVA